LIIERMKPEEIKFDKFLFNHYCSLKFPFISTKPGNTFADISDCKSIIGLPFVEIPIGDE